MVVFHQILQGAGSQVDQNLFKPRSVPACAAQHLVVRRHSGLGACSAAEIKIAQSTASHKFTVWRAVNTGAEHLALAHTEGLHDRGVEDDRGLPGGFRV